MRERKSLTTHNLLILIISITSFNGILIIIGVTTVLLITRKLNTLHKIEESNIVDSVNEVLRRLDHINKWQRLVARMLKEDREKLIAHDQKVVDLHEVAQEIAEKLETCPKNDGHK